MPKGIKGFQKGHKFFGDLSNPNYFKKGFKPWNKGKNKNTDIRILKISLGQTGNNNWSWQGDRPSYDALHAWLKRHYGKADKCESAECPRTHNIFHWAKLKEKEYERNRENFWMLCIKCHNNYDKLGFPFFGKNSHQVRSEDYSMSLES